MKKNLLLTIIFLVLTLTSCEDIADDFTGIFIDDPDPLITEADAASQNFSLVTSKFGIQVSIDENVNDNMDDVLEAIDDAATGFLNCQFEEGENIGFEDFELADGEIIPPLSELRVYVVPFTFECQAVDTDTCAGIHFGSDIITIARETNNTCEDYGFLEHEIAHRYGMDADHDNIEEFEDCIEIPGCGFFDFINMGLGG